MLRITLVSNAIHLEAARRLQRLQAEPPGGLCLLVYEARRLDPAAAERRLWPVQLAVQPLVMAALLIPALLGLVAELQLPHLQRAGWPLRWLVRRARRLTLLDDGLDQYRQQPRAVDPLAFAEGTPLWLFSDAPAFRASWCNRFQVQELGALYRSEVGTASAGTTGIATAGAAGPWRVLVLDSPGMERLAEAVAQGRVPALEGPRLVVPHPVLRKRAWRLPLRPQDRCWQAPPEPLIAAAADRLVAVGESMTLLAALALRPAGSPLLVALPTQCDSNLRRLLRARAAHDPAVEILE
jgi:hypothetical protein